MDGPYVTINPYACVTLDIVNTIPNNQTIAKESSDNEEEILLDDIIISKHIIINNAWGVYSVKLQCARILRCNNSGLWLFLVEDEIFGYVCLVQFSINDCQWLGFCK